jgi:hypothetical protein
VSATTQQRKLLQCFLLQQLMEIALSNLRKIASLLCNVTHLEFAEQKLCCVRIKEAL